MYRKEKAVQWHAAACITAALVAVEQGLAAAKLKPRRLRRWGSEHPSGGRAALPPRKLQQTGKEVEATLNMSC